MEVLGGDDTAEDWSVSRGRAQAHGAHLDLDLTDPAPQDDKQPRLSPGLGAGVARRALAAVFSSESLGTAGLVVAFLSLLAPPTLRLQMMFLTFSTTSPREQMSLMAGAITTGSALALVLGLGALLRLRPDPSTLARTVAGAATILGLLLIAVAAWLHSQVDGLPTSF